MQTGFARDGKIKEKITFSKSFDQAIDNLQCLFNYELSRNILYRINSINILKGQVTEAVFIFS